MEPTVNSSDELGDRHGLLKALFETEEKQQEQLFSKSMFLSGDKAIYSIPLSILQAIEEYQQLENPRQPLLSRDEMAIEKKFACLCDKEKFHGYSVRGRIAFPLLNSDQPASQGHKANFDQLINWVRKTIHKDINVDLNASVKAQLKGESAIQKMKVQRLAFMGYLQSNPQFQEEKDALRIEWIKAGANLTYLESRNLLKEFVNLPAQAAYSWNLDQAIANSFLAFYRRWDLNGMATWDLPLQQEPNLGGPSDLGQRMGLGSNPAIQMPVTLQLNSDMKAHHYLKQTLPEHLLGWQQLQDSKEIKQLAEAFILHFYQQIVLKGILGMRLFRKQQLLDQLLAQSFKKGAPIDALKGIKVETIEKIRQKHQRAVRAKE